VDILSRLVRLVDLDDPDHQEKLDVMSKFPAILLNQLTTEVEIVLNQYSRHPLDIKYLKSKIMDMNGMVKKLMAQNGAVTMQNILMRLADALTMPAG
jgi:hypothetical protein